MYTIAEEVLLYQQYYDHIETVKEANLQVAFKDILSDMHSSIWTFEDKSKLYLEEDTFYKMNEE